MPLTNRHKRTLWIVTPIIIFSLAFVGLPVWSVYARCPWITFNAGDTLIEKVGSALARLLSPQAALAGCGAAWNPPLPPVTCLTNDDRCYAVGRNMTNGEWGGGYAEWNMRKYPAPARGFTGQVLWVNTDNEVSGVWIEVGYTKGWKADLNLETYYWARMHKDKSYYEERVMTAPGAEGTNHTYEVHAWSPTEYRAYVDFAQVGQITDQNVPTKRIDVGLETLDSNSNIGLTQPTAMNYCDKTCDTSANWHPWTSGSRYYELPYMWEFRDGLFSRGKNWNANFPTLVTSSSVASTDARQDKPYVLPTSIRSAAGGPFISQTQALEEGKRVAAALGNSNPDRIDVRFTNYGQARAWAGSAGAKSTEFDDSREVWLVTLHGVVTMERTLPGEPLPQYEYVQVLIDATTGENFGISSGLGDWPTTLQ